jgi:hypothetical protein
MNIQKQVNLIQKGNKSTGILKVDGNIISLESKLCSISKEGEFYFYILKEIRAMLQLEGIFILINGSRVDVYPSGMSLSSNKAYVNTMGKQTSLNDLVDIFDNFTDLNKVSTVEEQNEYHENWIKSL